MQLVARLAMSELQQQPLELQPLHGHYLLRVELATAPVTAVTVHAAAIQPRQQAAASTLHILADLQQACSTTRFY